MTKAAYRTLARINLGEARDLWWEAVRVAVGIQDPNAFCTIGLGMLGSPQAPIRGYDNFNRPMATVGGQWVGPNGEFHPTYHSLYGCLDD